MDAATRLLAKAGIDPESLDEGRIALEADDAATRFVERCRALRFWERVD